MISHPSLNFKVKKFQRQSTLVQKTPQEFFTTFSEAPYSLLLLGHQTTSYIALNPILMIEAQGDDCFLHSQKETAVLSQNPFEVLRTLLPQLKKAQEGNTFPLSLFGYLGYEATEYLEPKVRGSKESIYQLPPLLFGVFQSVFRIQYFEDKKQSLVEEFHFSFTDAEGNNLNSLEINFQERRHSPTSSHLPWSSIPGSSTAEVFPSKKNYLENVEKIRKHIVDGDIYQANYTHILKSSLKTKPYLFFQKIFQENPAENYAYWNLPNTQILSCSPESFLKLENNRLLAHPIKGTTARGSSPKEDKIQLLNLLKSEKDASELNMIVDLFRNDLNKVCKRFSVKVNRHKYPLILSNVFHLLSEVSGVLDPKNDIIDILRATFPSGSITGCPKLRSIEILNQLEPTARSIYTGSIGYFSQNEMNLSVAIRTIICQNETSYFQVGGGIVYDSQPELEYQETLDKAQTFLMKVEPENPCT